MSLKNKTIPMIVIAVTLVASVAVLGINSIPAVHASDFDQSVRGATQKGVQGEPFGQWQSEHAQDGGLGQYNGQPK